MSESPEPDPAPSEEPDPVNPHSEDLDIEGPNESAPGHEPTEHDSERGSSAPAETDQ